MSSWSYKEGKASREDIVEGYQRNMGGRCTFTLDHDEVAHYPGRQMEINLVKVSHRKLSTLWCWEVASNPGLRDFKMMNIILNQAKSGI